jgi:hypothetical protein
MPTNTERQSRKRKTGDTSPTRAARSSNRVYFTQETENAIVQYNLTEDLHERELIYKNEIHKPLDKLAENVINRFKFPYIQGSFDEVKAQVVSFLVINLHKYTADKGKAFSYFSVIAKNYLIAHNNNAWKEEKRTSYFADKQDEQFTLDELLSVDTEEVEIKADFSEFFRLAVQYWDFNLTRLFKKKRDIEIANAVIELMRHVNSLENFNKKALYVMIREMTNYKTSHITKVTNKMRGIMMEQLAEFKRTGYIADPTMYFEYNNKKVVK